MPFCYSCRGIDWSVLVGPLFGPAICFFFYLGLAFMPLGAFLTHSIGHRLPWVISFSLGILDPFPFLEHPLPILILHSYGLLLSLLGFPGPITTSLTFGVDGLSINPGLT